MYNTTLVRTSAYITTAVLAVLRFRSSSRCERPGTQQPAGNQPEENKPVGADPCDLGSGEDITTAVFWTSRRNKRLLAKIFTQCICGDHMSPTTNAVGVCSDRGIPSAVPGTVRTPKPPLAALACECGEVKVE